MKPYLVGSGIILVAWLALVAVLSLLATLGLFGHDSRWVAYVPGLALVVGVVKLYQRFGLSFRHGMPVAAIVALFAAILFYV